MQFKAIISFLILVLFTGKLFLVDSGAIGYMSGEAITFVKPYCKKQQDGTADKPIKFQKQVEAENQVINFHSFCSPQIRIELTRWDFSIPEYISTGDSLLSSRQNYLYLDQHSPPPKLA